MNNSRYVTININNDIHYIVLNTVDNDLNTYFDSVLMISSYLLIQMVLVSLNILWQHCTNNNSIIIKWFFFIANSISFNKIIHPFVLMLHVIEWRGLYYWIYYFYWPVFILFITPELMTLWPGLLTKFSYGGTITFIFIDIGYTSSQSIISNSDLITDPSVVVMSSIH